jgi:hypothetical protein
MKIREIIDLNHNGMKMALIARDHLPVGEKKLYAILKEIGCEPPVKGKKLWTYDNVNSADLEKDITDFARVAAKNNIKASNSKSNNTKNKTTKNKGKNDIIENVKETSKKDDDMKAEIRALIKGTNKEESNRVYKGIYFDKDIAHFLDNIQHGNKSELVNKIMRQFLNENELL